MAMERIKTFLESSTIHGLAYISTTRKYVRLFWILVVITGFIGASLLIKESFDSWSESPIKTTIETLPISEIKFPKVTVCPPKNTFTDLNYDLMMTENMTLTEEMRDKMFKYAVEVINEYSFALNNWTKLQEDDRSYNWYHGFTRIFPSNYIQDSTGRYKLVNTIYTWATSGFVTTQYYGQQLKPDLVEQNLKYSVYVYPPKGVKTNENVTQHFKVEKVSMKRLAKGSWDRLNINGLGNLDDDKLTVSTNFTPPKFKRKLILNRHVSSEEVETMAMEFGVMPGFRFSWWYTGGEDFKAEPKYIDEEISKQYVRYVS